MDMNQIDNIVDLLKFYSNDNALIPQQDRIHLANGTLFLDGTFTEGKPEIVKSRLPISYFLQPVRAGTGKLAAFSLRSSS